MQLCRQQAAPRSGNQESVVSVQLCAGTAALNLAQPPWALLPCTWPSHPAQRSSASSEGAGRKGPTLGHRATALGRSFAVALKSLSDSREGWVQGWLCCLFSCFCHGAGKMLQGEGDGVAPTSLESEPKGVGRGWVAR